MNSLRRLLDRILGGAIALLMAVMVLNVLWQVFTRFIINDPSSFTEEAARYLMIWVGLLGAAFAFGQKAHLALDLITARLTGARKRASEIFIQATVLFFALAVMVGGGVRLVWIQLALGQVSIALGVKLGYVYLVVPLSGGFIALYSILSLLDLMRTRNEPAARSTEAGR
jgi:TRAP-type C4-dicarboxylate transport system permease small subunit